MPCPICSAPTSVFAHGQVLGDQQVVYRRCDECGFVFAADPVWLSRSYEDAITKLDVGLLDRSIMMSNVVAALLRALRLREGPFLDWAGGYGTLTRLLRDRGYDFRHYEPNARNIFAEGFDASVENSSYTFVTAVEVLEHLPDPVSSLDAVSRTSDFLFATTQVLPDPPPRPGEWWYYTPETGQHISFFTREALDALARRLGYDGVVIGSFAHLFYRGKVSAAAKRVVRHTKAAYLWGGLLSVPDRRRSFAQADMERAKNS